jgi:NAD+ synthase (glutamine-hydrolysing)
MIVALAQLNSIIGDFEGNRRRVLEALEKLPLHAVGPATSEAKPDLVVFPELALCGYPPLDLLDQDSFVEASLASLRRLQRELPVGLAVAVGYVDRNRSGSGRPLVNAVAVVKDGEILFTQAKTLLPTYDVFDEARYFEPALSRRVFEYCGERIGFAICEDIWWEAPPVPGLRYSLDPVKELFDAGANLLIVPSASPFHAGKLETRLALASDAARGGSVPLLYCNSTGANDSLVFDGRSFAVDDGGRTVVIAGWEEEVLLVDTASLRRIPKHGSLSSESASAGITTQARELAPSASINRSEEIERALVVGIRDYLAKCGFSKACLALSGGIDSAIVAVLAARAIGPANLTCVSMPSRFSSSGSVDDSVELCRRLGVRLETVPIEGPFTAFLELLEPKFEGKPQGLAEENLQARIRGAVAMTWSNKFDALLLTTGNKSELAAGYCTLYGDMCGALDPIGDLLKTEVYALARSMNARARAAGEVEPIPEAIIEKAPSAELRPNQTDQDSLPPYELLDAILDLYIVQNLSAPEIVAKGHDKALVERVIRLVARAEFKRRQAAPVIKVSPRAFGMGRRMPIARKIHEA